MDRWGRHGAADRIVEDSLSTRYCSLCKVRRHRSGDADWAGPAPSRVVFLEDSARRAEPKQSCSRPKSSDQKSRARNSEQCGSRARSKERERSERWHETIPRSTYCWNGPAPDLAPVQQSGKNAKGSQPRSVPDSAEQDLRCFPRRGAAQRRPRSTAESQLRRGWRAAQAPPTIRREPLGRARPYFFGRCRLEKGYSALVSTCVAIG